MGEMKTLTINDKKFKINLPDEQKKELMQETLRGIWNEGAVGDGETDDTTAFQNALENNRVVRVPGGTYKLSDTLVIRENCYLELSQDTILKFTQASGNCIEMRGSAVLRGNHAVVSVPYEFAGNAISMDTLLDGTNHASIPPYAKADPQWKRQRFVYDVNIVKPNSAGFNRPLDDGKCNGTAVYMSATNVSNDSTDIPFMWGITMSGIRIAGGFSYGIHAINYDSADGSEGHYADDAWNHDMRIEAVIEGCEIGVALENCNGAHLNVTVQPNTTAGGTKYAKQGVCLKDSRFVDMLRSRVWDWHVGRNDSEEYKHIALYGNCRGLLLDDFLVTEHPGTDIRDEIYTDTPSNFDTMTVLQEPANKWFKSVDGVPYFNDGIANRKLMLASEKITAEQVEFITPADGYYTYEPRFTNLAKNCTDGAYLLPNGTTTGFNNYTTTDFIAIDPTVMHTYRIGGDGVVWKDNSGYGRIAWYDADKNIIGMTMSWDKVGTNIYYPAWVEDDTVESAFITLTTQTAPSKAHYFRISAQGKGEDLIVTIDEKQEYEAVWHGEPKRLVDSVKVKAENVVGLTGGASSWNDVEVMPETQFAYMDSVGYFVGQTDFMLVPGRKYIVNWNGVEYTATAEYGEFTMGESSVSVLFAGNPVLIGGEDNGLPFGLAKLPMNGGMMGAIPMDSSTSVTVSIKSSTFYETSDTLLLDATVDTSTYKPTTVYATPEQIEQAFFSGKRIVAIGISLGLRQMTLSQYIPSSMTTDGTNIITFRLPTHAGFTDYDMQYNGDGTYVPYSD